MGALKTGIKWDKKLLTREDVKDLSKWVKQNHIEISHQVLKEEQRKGFPNEYRTRVDNHWDMSEKNVLPFGKIEYFAKEDISAALLSSYKMIIERSKIGLTGHYEHSNWVYYRNKIVARDYAEFFMWLKDAKIEDNSYFRFVNVTPYASRLELGGVRKGVTKIARKKGTLKKPFGARKPNGTYTIALRAIRNKFKQAGTLIKFEWVGGTSPITPPSVYGYRTTYIETNLNHSGQYVYPSIKFIVSAKGIL